MITFFIRTKIIKNNNFVYFAIKNIVIFHGENKFAFDEDNTFINKNNIQTIIKNKIYEIILPRNFSVFPVFCLMKPFLIERMNLVFQILSYIILIFLISYFQLVQY